MDHGRLQMHCSNTTEVHLLRFWEAGNVRKDGELMSLDMLLNDENLTVIQDSVNVNRQFMFRQCLNEGSVYMLSGCDVTRSNPKFPDVTCPFLQ
ncbi:unnamed protein product [Eruca vesicaria subsp. sativa]|uniref:Uncharacterized protein n=1 Tax=Eruca vesicaria subsp. sativa TaxID=29727 RepID=A0ABC8M092_ERUVS|nr:unnamed protein product [Eruca vesicaria subsp. sativa]